jgi:5'-3' exonuclease
MKDNEILIDGSYFIYNTYFNSNYIYHKTNNSEKINTSTDNYDWSKNNEFMRIFKNNIKKNLKKIKKKFNVSYNKIYFIRDCLRETIWRNDIYSEYKCDRKSYVKHKNIQLDLGNVFIEIYTNYLPEISKLLGIQIVKVDHAEADDIIYLFTKIIENKGKEVSIISNDSDFYQIVSDNVKMYEISLKEILLNKNRKLNVLRNNTYIKNLLLLKILRGDKSDNIKGFRISNKCFNINFLLKLMYINDNIDILIRNRKLMDWNFIPFNIKKNVLSIYNFLEKSCDKNNFLEKSCDKNNT